tara:strand:- start:2303 stop:2815 length:513 start_codon:yes stop_codon:yes gene_type:complete
MFRANFFYRFFQYRKNNNQAIVKYSSDEKFELQDTIIAEIIEIDQKISENSKDLLEAQIVKFRSTFSNSNTLISQIGRNVYKKKLDNTINWNQKQIKELYLKRRALQNQLEKIKGIFWLNRIKRFFSILLIAAILVLSLCIFVSGFMILIYLLPLLLLIFLGYGLARKKF